MIHLHSMPWGLDLGEWYRQHARPFLAEHAPDTHDHLGRCCRWLWPRDRRTVAVPVCFLGEAGVGKSSLINALLSNDTPLLPGGGVGPLTAIPVLARWAPEPFLAAECHGRDRLQEFIAALTEKPTIPPPASEHKSASPRSRARAALRQLALLLVGGNQFVEQDNEFLVSCLRAALDSSLPCPAGASEQVRARLAQITSTIAQVKGDHSWILRDGGLDPVGFLQVLTEHGAGHMAPMTRQIEVGYRAMVLEHATVLVDLPGLGVAQDRYVDVSEPYLNDAAGILLVVDRSGVPDSCARLLRETGFFRRLVKEPARTRPALMAAVVKLDLSVDEARAKERVLAGKRRTWDEHRNEHFAAAQSLVRRQIEAELQRARQEVEARTTSEDPVRIEVHPVLPCEFQRYNRNDPDDPSRLMFAQDSGIGGLRASLSRLGETMRQDFLTIVDTALAGCASRLEESRPREAAKATVLRSQAHTCATRYETRTS